MPASAAFLRMVGIFDNKAASNHGQAPGAGEPDACKEHKASGRRGSRARRNRRRREAEGPAAEGQNGSRPPALNDCDSSRPALTRSLSFDDKQQCLHSEGAAQLGTEAVEEWPDLLQATKIQTGGTGRLRGKSLCVQTRQSQCQDSVKREPPEPHQRHRFMQPRRDPLAIVWTCHECQAVFSTHAGLADHQDAEGHWITTLEQDGRTFVRKRELLKVHAGGPEVADPEAPGQEDLPDTCQLFSMDGTACFDMASSDDEHSIGNGQRHMDMTSAAKYVLDAAKAKSNSSGKALGMLAAPATAPQQSCVSSPCIQAKEAKQPPTGTRPSARRKPGNYGQGAETGNRGPSVGNRRTRRSYPGYPAAKEGAATSENWRQDMIGNQMQGNHGSYPAYPAAQEGADASENWRQDMKSQPNNMGNQMQGNYGPSTEMGSRRPSVRNRRIRRSYPAYPAAQEGASASENWRRGVTFLAGAGNELANVLMSRRMSIEGRRT